MKADSCVLAILAAVIIVLAPLIRASAATAADSTVVTAESGDDASGTSSAIGTLPNVSEISPETGQQSEAEEIGDQGIPREGSLYPSALSPEVRPMRDYLRGGPRETHEQNLGALGIQVEDAIDRFNGQDVWGAEVLNVRPASPGALAGLQSRRAAVSIILQTVTIAGMLAFPPAAVGYMLVTYNRIGDWHDLIIGVDGERVHDVSDLENALGQVTEGDVVYLSVLRAGKRLQVTVSLHGVDNQ